MTLPEYEKVPFLGVFDSGIGGLSVVREIMRQSPGCRIIYLADTLNHPYGPRSADEVLTFSRRITEFFMRREVHAIVLACNTASAAALHPLRELYPQVKFVGMEPAVKPAAELTVTGKVGVLATMGTFCGKPYAGVVDRFARGMQIFEQPCPGLAEMIEHEAPREEIAAKLYTWIAPMRDAGVDQIALACTHYPLIIDLIRRIAGEGINVIDPSPAVAKQALRVIGLTDPGQGTDILSAHVEFYATAGVGSLLRGGSHYLQLEVNPQLCGDIFNGVQSGAGEKG